MPVDQLLQPKQVHMLNDDNVIKFFKDVKDAFEKAIGTSSSINEERDERSVENYVRTGGNTMENTTEPDPKGDIAINKVISGETAPEGNESVSDAPNNPGIVPNNETFPGEGSAVATSREDEMNQPEKVTIAKGEKCPTCGSIAKGDDTEAEEAIEKAVDEAESKEEDAKETPADEVAEMKKSLWGGAFAPRK